MTYTFFNFKELSSSCFIFISFASLSAQASDLIFSKNCAEESAIAFTQSPTLSSSELMNLRTIQVQSKANTENN